MTRPVKLVALAAILGLCSGTAFAQSSSTNSMSSGHSGSMSSGHSPDSSGHSGSMSSGHSPGSSGQSDSMSNGHSQELDVERSLVRLHDGRTFIEFHANHISLIVVQDRDARVGGLP